MALVKTDMDKPDNHPSNQWARAEPRSYDWHHKRLHGKQTVDLRLYT